MFFICIKKLDKEISKRDKFLDRDKFSFVTCNCNVLPQALLCRHLLISADSVTQVGILPHVAVLGCSLQGRCDNFGVKTWLIFERDCPCS